MAWALEGRYFENCSCEVVCPCAASLALGSDYDRCQVVFAFEVDDGEVDGVDVGGLTAVVIADTPKYMLEGNWRLGVLIDDSASEEQAEKLAAVFGGQLGGPMGALAGLVGEVLGVERARMEFSEENGHHRVIVGALGDVAVQDVVPFGADNGEPARLAGVLHPVASELNIAKADDGSHISAFGLTLENGGKSGFSARFAWSS